jgi:hypothetical protein
MVQRGWLSVCAVTFTLAAAWPSAQGPAGPGAAPAVARDISGFWGLEYDGRKVPPANLLPSVTRSMLDEVARRDAHNIRWCNLVGVPAAMDMGRPLDIRQGPTTLIMVPEAAPVAPRYVYLNRSQHIDPDVFDPSTNGDSIGRWEGDELVVDTIGFHETHGLLAIPGGGYRTPTAHLVERYRIVGQGNVMHVSFTWTDPAMFRTPHTYEFRYVRYPATYEAVTPAGCMPWDPVRSAFFEPPSATPAAR